MLVFRNEDEFKAHVQRAKGDTSPLQVSVKLQACNDKSCIVAL